jgi:hypothetical protein
MLGTAKVDGLAFVSENARQLGIVVLHGRGPRPSVVPERRASGASR